MIDYFETKSQPILKWVKWEKDLYKYVAIKWLKHKYKESPKLFAHWQWVSP